MQEEATQLRMEELLEEGIFKSFPVSDEHIGGNLLPLVTKGQYGDPLHAIREYVQNAYDAGAAEVIIKIAGSSLTIHDNGSGMNLSELDEARGLGVSPKDTASHVGFRGIGIYSAYEVCDRLIISTKKLGEPRRYVLEFDFAGMKEQLARDKAEKRRVTPLKRLLSDYTLFAAYSDARDAQFSTVQLQNIDKSHLGKLVDRNEVKRYLMKTLPIGFARVEKEPSYGTEVIDDLEDKVKGFRAIRIMLEFQAEKREEILRPIIPNVGPVTKEFINGDKGKPIAYYWATLHQSGSKIPDEYEDFRGFVFKVKGFTVGDNQGLRRLFKFGSSVLYQWYTGEIYVLDPDVVPNAPRDDFEHSIAKVQLDEKVAKVLTDLDKKALKFQEETRAEKVFVRSTKKVASIEKGIVEWINSRAKRAQEMTTDEDDDKDSQFTFGQHTQLEQVIKDVKAQRPKLRDKTAANNLIEKAQKLQGILRKPVQDATASAASQQNQKDTTGRGSSSRDGNGQTTENTDGRQHSPTEEPNADSTGDAEPQRTLLQAFEDAGWNIGEDCLIPLRTVDDALADVLGYGSPPYNAILETLERKLLWHNSGRR